MGLLFSRRKQKTLNKFQFGNACFQIENKDHQKIQKINQENYNILFNADWNLEYLEYAKGNWSQVFKNMKQADAQILALYKSGSLNIIKQIAHIKFNKLQILSLGKNKISSVQSLAFLQMPCLQSLRLNENQIYRIQSLTKLNCKKLHCLILEQNPIIDLNKIPRIKFETEYIGTNSKLFIQFIHSSNHLNQEDKDETLNENITYLMKLQLKKTYSLVIEGSILRKKHMLVFGRKNNIVDL